MTRFKHSLMQAGPQPQATTPEIATYLGFISRHGCNGDARSYILNSRTRAAVACVLGLYEELSEGHVRREAGDADRSFLFAMALSPSNHPKRHSTVLFLLVNITAAQLSPIFPKDPLDA